MHFQMEIRSHRMYVAADISDFAGELTSHLAEFAMHLTTQFPEPLMHFRANGTDLARQILLRRKCRQDGLDLRDAVVQP